MKVRIKSSELARLSNLSGFTITKFVQLGLGAPKIVQHGLGDPKYDAPIRADEYHSDFECDVKDEPLFMLKVIQYGIKHETIG